MLSYTRLHGRCETGGILIGSISEGIATATIEFATGPTSDSRHGRTRFTRGVAGLAGILDSWWQRTGSHYLGEWHTHPSSAPVPSQTDKNQMKRIASDSNYNCRTPILIVVGGIPDTKLTITVSVFDGATDRLLQLGCVTEDGKTVDDLNSK